MEKNVVVIGGGIAGMESATHLAALGFKVTLIEKEAKLGGHLLKWEKLFPTMRMGKEVVTFLNEGIGLSKVNVIYNAEIIRAVNENNIFSIFLKDNTVIKADAVLVTTGYDLFKAEKKEEYGYGIYDNVITSAELEEKFISGNQILTAEGKVPKRIGFVHCVGSRDEKAGNTYCSKVCCVTAVKQSIEIKEHIPDAQVYCFYMDLRMYGMHFEALFREAQEKWSVNFIRGRLSEACENIDGSILVKVEDTLAGKPMRMSVDMLVLMVGFEPSEGTRKIGNMFGLKFGVNRFFKTADQHTLTNVSDIKGVFFAGSCTGPKTITNTITDARAAASTVANYLNGHDIDKRIIIKAI